MTFLNRDFYTTQDVFSFINSSILKLINQNTAITSSKEYLLFYYIKENFSANFYSLYNTDIDLDCLGFTLIQRNTRHSIESFLDLINLSNDLDYLSVLEYCANPKRPYHSKYHSIIKGKLCNIPKKSQIATQMYNVSLPKNLLTLSANSNKYVHPNVFIDIINGNELEKKMSLLQDLLNINLEILIRAYICILNKFNNGIQPCLYCPNCTFFPPKPCNSCFLSEKNKFQNLINNGLITYNYPVQSYYPIG